MKQSLAQIQLFACCCPTFARGYATRSRITDISYTPRRRTDYVRVGSSSSSQDDDELPATILEARRKAKEAAVSTTTPPLQPFYTGNKTTRPQGRLIPLGVKRPPRKQPRLTVVEDAGREKKPHEMPTLKQVFKKAKPAFRSSHRSFSIAASSSSIASTSAVTIEAARLLEDYQFSNSTREIQPSLNESAAMDGVSDGENALGQDSITEQEGQTRLPPRQWKNKARARALSDDPISDTDKYRRSPLFTRGHKGRWIWGSAPTPRNTADLANIIRNVSHYTPGRTGYLALLELHERLHAFANTTTYNRLLQDALRMRDMQSFNRLLGRMNEKKVEKDALTWDMLMESYAASGNWEPLVSVYEARQQASVPLDIKGWTRVAQAATRNGTISLSEEAVSKNMSPIYNAVYNNHLPRGVRQVSLRQMVKSAKTDVDQVLAAMMPKDASPLDFQATLVVAHRLAKQRRWREADDVVAHWLDRAEQERRGWVERLTASSAEGAGTPAATATANVETLSSNEISDNFESWMETTSINSLSLLHVLLEGFVISRASPENVQAYLENFLERHSAFRLKPTYHTIFLVLTSYRGHPLRERFDSAKAALEQMEQLYKPRLEDSADNHSRRRCLRLVQQYGTLTIQSYGLRSGTQASKRELVQRIRREVQGMHYKDAMGSSKNMRDFRRDQNRQEEEGHLVEYKGPVNHDYAKEFWKHRRLRYKAAEEKYAQDKGAKAVADSKEESSEAAQDSADPVNDVQEANPEVAKDEVEKKPKLGEAGPATLRTV